MNKKIISIALAFGCVSSIAATNNYDLLGRKGSKMTTPMVYRNVDYAKANNDVKHALAKQSETQVTRATGAMKHTYLEAHGCSHYTLGKTYWFNDKELTQSEYVKKVDKYESSYKPRINYNGFGEAHQRKIYSRGWKVLGGEDFNPNGDNYKEKSRYEKNVTTTYRDINRVGHWRYVSHIASELGRSAYYLYPSFDETIGVYLASDATLWNTAKLYNKCQKNAYVKSYESTANYFSSMYVLKNFANNMNLFFYDYECDETNGTNTQFIIRPDLLPVHMGVHTNGVNEVGDGSYNDRAAYLDDYIYENRMIEIVAAGNLAKTPTDDNFNGYTRKTASALNAITVGAVETSTNKIAAYTGWKNPKYVTGEKKSFDKPEIYGYTNFFTRDQWTTYESTTSGAVKNLSPTHGGTEAAAAYIGGMVESLLSSEPFYKWHPEVVKALLLTSSDIDVMPKNKKGKIDYAGNDFIYTKDNKDLILGLTDYAKVFIGNTSRYWIANNSSEIMTNKENGEPYLTFTEELKGDRVRIAISWLSKSSYAVSKGRTPQDFDLYVYDKNGNEIAKSTTGDNPFELVDVSVDPYSTITIKIKLPRDNGERILLGYNMFDYGYTYMPGCTVGF